MKFYAVKNGRLPGIYLTWDECIVQVTGFSGAVYKAFSTQAEAQKFVDTTTIPYNLTSKIVKTVDFFPKTIPKVIDIYTDGSHKRNINFLGLGAWCKYDSIEYKISNQCSYELLNYYQIQEFANKVSSPTMEFIAVAEVLRKFNNMQQNIQILFHCDYIGPMNWISGIWKSKEPYIRNILEICKNSISSMKCEILFEHVKGHSGIEGNEKADILASSSEKFDNFDILVDLLASIYLLV